MGAPEVPPEAAGVNRQHASPRSTRRNQAAWYQRERERARNARIATLVPAYDSSDPEKILRGIAFNYMN